MSSCCPSQKTEPHGDSCHTDHKSSFDWILYGSLAFIVIIFCADFVSSSVALIDLPQSVTELSVAILEFLKKMWWGIVFGSLAVGLMNKIPRAYFRAAIGKSNTFSGLCRAVLAGVLLDVCSHGILMIGAKLYERGVSLPQVMAFLVASPWNSISLTLILISLIGLPWTLTFIIASAVIALITGVAFMACTKKGILPKNPYTDNLNGDLNLENYDENLSIWKNAGRDLKTVSFNFDFVKNIIVDGIKESQMIIRWILLGTIIAALIQVFVPTDTFETYFGPSILGLGLTLVAATVLEVCSEGMAPIGADLVTRAAAPGNGFTFLMAGVATDYTEILVIREFSKRWKTAFFLPLITVPQILIIGLIMNL